MKRLVLSALDRIGRIGALPGDSLDQRLRRTILVLFACFTIFFPPWEGLGYLVAGYPAHGALMIGYSAIGALSLLAFAITRKLRPFRATQLALVLLFPFVYQWSFGGFAPSGGVGIWALLAPLGALLFYSRRASLWWFGAYVALTIASGLAQLRPGLMPSSTPPRDPILFSMANAASFGVVAYALLLWFVRERDRARAGLAVEQERSERLLLNILPKAIADRLKDEEKTIADGFGEVTVLFADIVGFTKLSARTAPSDLVLLLNRLFTAFDELAEKHGLEKIKTIGDAYMAAAGLPLHRPDHADVVADMALDMQSVVERFSSDLGESLSVRIGLNTGPVVAGVIGTRKFIYDLWGDTVNTASRMESHSLPGRIQLTDSTRAKLDARYVMESRGVVDVKGKGEMETWFLVGRR